MMITPFRVPFEPGVIDDLRARSLTIRPSCPYAAAYMRDRPETHDLYAA